MENTGDHSECSSDENAMVIDESYVEKDVKETNKTKTLEHSECGENKGVNSDVEDVERLKFAEADYDGDETSVQMHADEDNENKEDNESEEVEESVSEEDGDGTGEDSSEEGSEDGGEEGIEGEKSEQEEEDWESDNEGTEIITGAAFVESDSGDEQLDSCPICLNKFRGQDVGSPESCDHNFCLDCIMEWANNVNTCPVDRQVFHLVLAKHADCENVYKRFPIEDKNVQESEEDSELTYCEVCHECNREDRLLLCDGCDKGYHCECLDPPLDSVPIEEWFCPECAITHTPGGVSSRTVEEGREGSSVTEKDTPRPTAHASPMRRQIPRTQASERVRTRIQATRAAIAQMFDSEVEFNKFSSSSVSPTKPVTRKQKLKRKSAKGKAKTTKRKSAKRKTTKRKSTKRGKTKGKKRKVTKRKKKASPRCSSYSPRSSAVAPLVTPKSRLAKSLGLSKPPQGRSIPLQKMAPERSMEGQKAAVGITLLSIMGSRDELIGFQDGDESMAPQDPQPSSSKGFVIKKKSAVSSKYSQSALESRRPIQRPRLFARNEYSGASSPGVPILTTSSAGPLDILGSIIQEQDKLLIKGEHITINRDGSLTAKQTGKGKTSYKLQSEQDTSMETESDAEPGPLSAVSNDDLGEAGRSPYTDSDDDIREPIITAENDSSKEFHVKSPHKDRQQSSPKDRLPSPPKDRLPSPLKDWLPSPPKDRLPSPPRNWNKSPPTHWQRKPSPPTKVKHVSDDQKVSETAKSSSPIRLLEVFSPNPSHQNPSPQQSSLASPPLSPHASSYQPSPVIDEIEPFPLCKDGYDAEDSRSPCDSAFITCLPSGLLYDPISDSPVNLDKDSNSFKEQGDKQKLSSDLEAPLLIKPIKNYSQRLSVDSEDSLKEESQPRVPFSELPRIPKKKRQSDPIEVITIDDDEEEKTEDTRAVLNHPDAQERKGYLEKRESKGRQSDYRGDRRERRSSYRRRDVPEDNGNCGRSGQQDKRRVVLNERGGLIVRTEDSSHGEASHRKRLRDKSRSKSRERGQNRSRGHWGSWDKCRSKEDSHGSRSGDQSHKKRRHEHKEKSRSGSRSDQERHDKSHKRKKKRRDLSPQEKQFLETEEEFDHQHDVRGETKVITKDKTDPRERAKEKSSKERNDLKDSKSDRAIDKHYVSMEKSDLRGKIDSRNKVDLREHLDSRARGDLREKLDTKFRDKIDFKLKPETKDTQHVEDHDTNVNSSEMYSGSKRSFNKASDSFEPICDRVDKTVVNSPVALEDTWSSPKDLIVSESSIETKGNFKVNSTFCTGASFSKRDISSSGHENSIGESKKRSELKLDSSSVTFDSSSPKPLLPTPFLKVHEIQPPVEAMYDPSMPTETASPPVFVSKEMIEQPPDTNPLNLQQPPEFLLGNRLQSPGGTGILGDGSFLIPSDPGMINVLQPHQNLGPIPMSLGMLPPGFPPGLHPVSTRPHLVMNPLLLNRPPPFTRLPQMHGGMPRFNWTGVDPQVLQVPNHFDGKLKDQNVVELQNRFTSPFPSGPSPMHTRPNLVNGNFDSVQSNSLSGQLPFTSGFRGRDDPRQTLMQPSIKKTAEMGEKVSSDQGRTTLAIKPSSNPLTEISKLLNLQAQLVGLAKGGNTTTTNSSAVKGCKGVMFKVPHVPPVQGSAGSRSAEKSSLSAHGRDETEVVDMDMSPLEDDDNIVISPEYEKELKAEKDDKVSRVIFMNKADDVPCSAVQLTNKQKAGKFMKKLHLQERVVEEVKLAIKPFYAKKKISKEEYKDILRKSVPKICHSRSGDINPAKIKSLIEAYVSKCERAKDKVTKSNGERARSKSSR